MGIRTISIAFAAAALIGTSSMAAAPVMPSAAQLSLAPVAGTNLGSTARLGTVKSNRSSSITGGGAVIGVLAAAAVVGGVVAATSNGHSSTSP
ncbi:hypothetical protein [Sphingomonas oryzagri]|jgi:hypothetical protein|uniref:Uncharacterized protein n=1 Tax=Sphingomonas oryzagri TaxID=3042314 RepID=A0ABT6MW82_9SPHN|nr:hypothetical protein [Sphingomonas oryzagri]MDH7637285.1 hypothetical protein [Sphingomonas oryzagri]